VEVLNGESIGKNVLIPRIELEPSDPAMAFTIKGFQFSIQVTLS
jgi:hypothetical protein